MNKFDYKEPEFKVVFTDVDILTASGDTPAGSLGTVGAGWDTGSGGGGVGGIGFNV